MKNFLDEILASKRKEVAEAKKRMPMGDIMSVAKGLPAARGLIKSLQADPAPRVIAEIKRRSPSKGDINPGLDAAKVAGLYEAGGAASISVLTDGPYFGGSLDDLKAVRNAVSIPLLRKDFVVDPYQVWEAKSCGADAILLIVAALTDGVLSDCSAAAEEAAIDALVEIHAEGELDRAMRAGAKLIGINSRDLRTFKVDTELALRLRDRIPRDVPAVVESGIKTRGDIEKYMEKGYRAFLVGEALTSAPDIGGALEKLVKG